MITNELRKELATRRADYLKAVVQFKNKNIKEKDFFNIKDEFANFLATQFNLCALQHKGETFTSTELDNLFKNEVCIPYIGGIGSRLAEYDAISKNRVGQKTLYSFLDNPVHRSIIFKVVNSIYASRDSYGKNRSRHTAKKEIDVNQCIAELKKLGYKVMEPYSEETELEALELLKAAGYENIPEPQVKYREI